MKFIGFQIDNHLNWANHVDKLIPKLSEVCFAVRYIYHNNNDTPKSVYSAYFHFVGGNSSNRKMIFNLQNKIFRLVAGVTPINSGRNLFKTLESITFPCKYTK
jgi:hypothetical protein